MSAQKICPQCGTEYELDQRFCPKDGSTLKSQNAGGDLVGTIIADRYHVLRKLGEGGMGTVYLAEHVKMGRKSAVKVMNPAMVNDADAISRFNREAANASKISHPNVAAVYDFGETSEGLIYLAMEFVEGPPLTKIIEESGALPAIRAADIARQTADALSVAHDMGIVHRDLKPDNIMLAKNRDGSDCVKVVDFGIAKVANNESQKVTRTGLVVGTPEYMSPEQLAGDKLDGRSDIYSLGLVAFAMMTGKLPFPGETVQESMIARLTDEPKRLIEMKPDVNWPPAVQVVMDKALQRDFETRYKSAGEFGRDLYNAVASMPESAATNAFTAVMNRLSTPAIPPVAVASPPKGTKIVPPTRVNRASSREAVPVTESRSRTNIPLWVIVGVVAIAGLSVVSIQLFGPQGTAVADTSAGQVAARAADPNVLLERELEAIDPLASDTTAARAREALSRLAVLD
ncbi:MAG: protein kinase domain-containing protein, partial [Gemmatimonadaceae bacterium]